MKICILKTKLGETACKLVNCLKNSVASYELLNEKSFIVSYGRLYRQANLNSKIISNKLEQLKRLRRGGLNIPEIYMNKPEDLLRSYFPLLARKIKHFRGNDIIYLKTRRSLFKRLRRVKKRDFFVKYINKKEEFRVHVLGDTVANISKKVHSPNTDTHHPHVWSSLKGWTLVNYEGVHYEVLSELGKKAIKILEYDFGAVDIGLGNDGKFYIFEVNSAPRLSRQRRRLYAKFFRKREREFSQNHV